MLNAATDFRGQSGSAANASAGVGFARIVGTPISERARNSTANLPTPAAPPTLTSYGIDFDGDHDRTHAEVLRLVPEAHLRWLETLPLWHLTPQALFVHAGIRPGVDLSRQTEHDLVWIRKGFLDDSTDHGPLVVHGHTVVDQVTHFGNRLAIDTGAAYGGPLSAVVFDAEGLHLLGADGRMPVVSP